MNELVQDLAIAVLGGLVTVVVIFLSKSGVRVGRDARNKVKAAREEERQQWATEKIYIRQGITNRYLFSVLQCILLGNLLWLVPEFIIELLNLIAQHTSIPSGGLHVFWLSVTLSCRGAGILVFLVGVGRILRYLELKARK